MRRITVSPRVQSNALLAPVVRLQKARLYFSSFIAQEELPSSHAFRSRRSLPADRTRDCRIRIVLPLITFAMLLAGCAVKPIPIAVEVMKPAELDLGPVRKLAVSDFQGPGGSALSNKLVTKLFEGRRFEILERSRLARILDELALPQSGIVDETTAAKVGKAAGVDALIFGEADTSEVTDEKTVTPLTRSRIVGYRTECGKKRCYQVPGEEEYVVNAPTTIRRGHVGASLRVVGVESGQIVASPRRKVPGGRG